MTAADLSARRSEAARKAWETMRARGITPGRTRSAAAPATVRATVRKAPRAEAPTVVLGFIPPRDTSRDADEWVALALEHSRFWYNPEPVRPAFSDRPHPQSYGADLPMRSELAGRKTKRWTLTAAERAHLASRGVNESAAPAPVTPVVIRPNAPHPDSEGAHLPLRGLKFTGPRGRHTWPLTAAEKASLAGRPIRYIRPDPTGVETCQKSTTTA